VKDVESQKDFALAIKDLPFNGALFALRAKKTSIKEYLKGVNIRNLCEGLGLRTKDED